MDLANADLPRRAWPSSPSRTQPGACQNALDEAEEQVMHQKPLFILHRNVQSWARRYDPSSVQVAPSS